MKKLEVKIPNNTNIFLIGDRHKGSSFSSDSDWEKAVDMISQPYDDVKCNVVVDHGDVIEGIAIDDPRYDPMEHKDSILKQIHDAADDYKPIAGNMITMLDGNHPIKLSKRFGGITADICKTLGIPFGTWSAHITYTNLKGDKVLFKHFATHGRLGITSTLSDPHRRRASLEHRLRSVLKSKFGDCLLMSRGHTHKVLSSTPARDLFLYMNGDIHQGYKEHYSECYIPPSLRYYASTGSFFKLYGEDGHVSYAEEADYDPIELGFCVAKVRDGQLAGIDEVIL